MPWRRLRNSSRGPGQQQPRSPDRRPYYSAFRAPERCTNPLRLPPVPDPLRPQPRSPPLDPAYEKLMLDDAVKRVTHRVLRRYGYKTQDFEDGYHTVIERLIVRGRKMPAEKRCRRRRRG